MSSSTIVFTDMDNTLCFNTPEGVKVHPTTPKAIQKLSDHDIPIVPVTGRGPKLANLVLDLVGLPHYPSGCHHGAITFDAEGNKILDHNVPESTVDALVEAALRLGKRGVDVRAMVQFEDKHIIGTDKGDFGYQCIKEHGSKHVYCVGENLPEAAREAKVYQCTLCLRPPQETSLLAQQQELAQQIFEGCLAEAGLAQQCKVMISGSIYIDCISVKADKSACIDALSKIMNFERKDVVALGDAHNDLGMLKAAGKSVSMGNGLQAVKDVSQFVTGTVQEGGWSQGIEMSVFGA